MRQSRNQRGQALVEAGITIVLFLTIALGLVTFGHAFMAANMLTHAARDGARLAATWPQRGPCGALCNGTTCGVPITDTSFPIIQTVNSEIATVLGGTFTITVSQNPIPPASVPTGGCPQPATPTVTLNVNGCVPWVIPLLPASLGTPCNGSTGFAVNRTVVFHDEGLKY